MDIFRRNFNKLAVVTIFPLYLLRISTFQDYGTSVDENSKIKRFLLA